MSRKRYKEVDIGTIDQPMPKRDPLWKEDADLKEAQTRADDDFWIDVMKKKFHRKENSEDLGIKSDKNLDVALHKKTSYVCNVDLGYESEELEIEEEDDEMCINNPPYYLGTCFALTPSQTLMEQSLAELGEPDEDQMAQKKENNTIDVQTGPSSTNGIERAGLTEQGRKEQFICHLQAIGVRCGDGRKEINEFYAKWDQMR